MDLPRLPTAIEFVSAPLSCTFGRRPVRRRRHGPSLPVADDAQGQRRSKARQLSTTAIWDDAGCPMGTLTRNLWPSPDTSKIVLRARVRATAESIPSVNSRAGTPARNGVSDSIGTAMIVGPSVAA